MADIWADFPSGSRGIYGDDETAMLDGIWAQNDSCVLAADPDSTIGDAGRVLSSGSDSSGRFIRMVLPAAKTTLGIARRLYMGSLPTQTSGLGTVTPRIVTFLTAGNSAIATVWVTTSGGIVVSSGEGTSGTVLGQTDGPVVSAGAWWHIEVKFTVSATAGAVEVRVNGVPKIDESDLDTGSTDIGQFSLGTYTSGAGGGAEIYCKDLVVWDTSGDHSNDFHGSVSAYWCPVASTNDIGGWTKSKGTDVVPLLDDAAPHNTLTCAGAISADETVRIDGTYYKFTSGSVDTGTPAGTSGAPWLVALGDDDAGSLANLAAAIDADGTAGTDYSTALTAHATVVCRGLNETKLSVASQDGATTSMMFAETGAHLSWASTTALSYGPDDASFISADSTPPDAAEFTLTGLPDDITSVRAIIPVVRAAKVDGGDGSLQLSLSPNGTDYDTGPDTPITTAFTYWGNATAPFVSDENPATSAAWTPSDFATGVRLKIDRTT
jgi:hypothetical protein